MTNALWRKVKEATASIPLTERTLYEAFQADRNPASTGVQDDADDAHATVPKAADDPRS